MKFVFIDETENSTHVPGFYAVCAVAVDSTKYGLVRDAVDRALDDCGWCRSIEFKGALIFSATKGDSAVSTERRVDAASAIVSTTVSKANNRASSAIAWTDKGGSNHTHIELVTEAVSRALKAKPGVGAGKDLVMVFADTKDGIKRKTLSQAVASAVNARGYRLVEDVVVVSSGCEWPGVLLADILAYLGMWTYAGHSMTDQQLSLFEGGKAPSTSVLNKMTVVQAMLESGAALQFHPRLT
ncbi:MAG: hypothetical protein RQ731_08410 [Anaerosomatales bacterium]|nr:hypothetical protein [Anaerosomatales bacterium]